ncbi:MAG: cupin domain-containing protein [Proteobacteria bacterium]|nr:cupin domain-containing protein [Burkholderiales bacterium]
MPAASALPPTRSVTPEQMNTRVARFRSLKPQSSYYRKDAGIPSEAYEMVTAKTLYTLMAPSGDAGPMSATPAILSDDKLAVIIAECPPGDKPMLHAHFQTTEHFFCLKGRFRIRWGDAGEHELMLDPFDMIAVPRGVCRDFTNVTDETAYLLVMITGEAEQDYNDIGFAPEESARFKQRFGPEVAARLESIGFSFIDAQPD